MIIMKITKALEKFIEDLKSSIAFINSVTKDRVEVAKASGLKNEAIVYLMKLLRELTLNTQQ